MMPPVTSTAIESTSVEERVAVLSLLADPTRLRILDGLSDGVRCVCELQDMIPGVAANLLSYHLRVLREAGLIEATRRGRWVDYRLAGDADAVIRRALPIIGDHLR